MNRRDFIKGAAALPAVGLIPLSNGSPEHIPLTGTTCDPNLLRWDYIVYCYEREQGEWVFSKNVRGSFAPEREYMTFEEEEPNGYLGFMYDGVLHFQTFDDATEFVQMHVRTKIDVNLLDSIYDVYRQSDDGGAEIQVSHYWFN